MSEELMKLNPEIENGMATMTPNKIAKIRERMVEMDRANQSLGRKNTQTTNQLMTLTMLTESPYRMMRQCLTQIEKKRQAVEEAHFNTMTNRVKIKDLRVKGDELSMIEATKMEHGEHRNLIYIEGALKEIAVFQEAYDEIRKNHNIPENWDGMWNLEGLGDSLATLPSSQKVL